MANIFTLNQNITVEVEGDILTLKIDMSKEEGKSGSGKSTVIASTHGNVIIPNSNNAMLGLNLYRKL